MGLKGKIITILCISVVGIGGITYYIINRNHDRDFVEPPIIEDKKENKDSKEEISKEDEKDSSKEDEDIVSKDKDQNSSTILNVGKDNSLPSNVQRPSESGKPEEKPVVPSEPTIPDQPTNPSDPEQPSVPEEISDLVINDNMIENGSFSVTNKKYNNITIESNVQENVRIELNRVEIVGELVLENPKNYQLDIINSSLPSMIIANHSISRLAFRSRTVMNQNKTLEGPTINIGNQSKVDAISISGNVQINGTDYVQDLDVFSGNEVILNVPSKNVSLNTNGLIAINKNVDTLVNSGTGSTIIVNAPVTTLSNNESSTVRLNQGNTITNFKNQGDNTIVSGNGTITNVAIHANNTRIYTDVTNTPIIGENIDNILIRKESKINIESAISNAQGSVTFTLSEVTPLTLNDISVICNAGKSITLFHLTTKDNKTYTLTTSYYKNDSYALYITLPNGNIISKDFDTDYANPTVNNVVLKRISDREATLELYGVDEGGTIYYMIEDASTREIINADVLKENGKSSLLKVGYNAISISELEPSKTYHLYYTIEGYFENISKVKGPFEISSQVEEKLPSNYQIIYAREEIPNRFVFTLDKAPNKELTLNDFEIECPQEKNLTIRGAQFIVSPDRLTYIIIVPDNYGHGDNKYTVKIQVSDSEKIEGNFVSHFNPPVITGAVDNVSRIDENTAEFNFNSDEAGTVYYGVYEWNGGIYDYNSTTPFATDVLTNAIESKQQKLNAGLNTITIDLTGITTTRNTRVWALFVDESGNYRVGFVDHYKIPEYIGENPNPSESTLEITNFEVMDNNYFVIDFNEEIDWISSDNIELSVIANGSLPAKILYVIDNDTPKHLTIRTQNYTLPIGTYELKIHTNDKNGNSVTLTKRFEIK